MASNAAVFKRRLKIIELVNRNGILSVEDLSKAIDVSPITIRRDLDHLVSEGSILRKHGSAVSVTFDTDVTAEKSLNEKDVLNIEEKVRIAAKATSLVSDDELLFMNSGSTTLCFLSALRGRHVKIITNNAAAIRVERTPEVELMILGGEYREQSQSFVGEFALSALHSIYSDHTFLGTNGLSLDKGLTTSVYQECSINQAMIEHTHGNVVVLADSSKLGKVAHFVSASLDKIDIVITDEGCPKDFREGLEAMGITVILA